MKTPISYLMLISVILAITLVIYDSELIVFTMVLLISTAFLYFRGAHKNTFVNEIKSSYISLAFSVVFSIVAFSNLYSQIENVEVLFLILFFYGFYGISSYFTFIVSKLMSKLRLKLFLKK